MTVNKAGNIDGYIRAKDKEMIDKKFNIASFYDTRLKQNSNNKSDRNKLMVYESVRHQHNDGIQTSMLFKDFKEFKATKDRKQNVNIIKQYNKEHKYEEKVKHCGHRQRVYGHGAQPYVVDGFKDV